MRVFAIICSTLIGTLFFCPPITAQAKTAKECRAEWQAKKAEFQAKKIKEKDYVKDCTAAPAAAAPAPEKTKAGSKTTKSKSAPTPATTTKTEQKSAPKITPAAAPAAKPSSTALGANQYTTESQAKARCGSGTVVWANLDSKIYHFAGYKAYGSTKTGAYMCESDATKQGIRAAKNEKHP